MEFIFKVATMILPILAKRICRNEVSKSGGVLSLLISSNSQLLQLFTDIKILLANLTVPLSTRCNPSLNKSSYTILLLSTKCAFNPPSHSVSHLFFSSELTVSRFSSMLNLHLLITILEKITVSTP